MHPMQWERWTRLPADGESFEIESQTVNRGIRETDGAIETCLPLFLGPAGDVEMSVPAMDGGEARPLTQWPARRTGNGAEHATEIDYKDIKVLRNFVTERGKLIPRRISGNCARHQRQMTIAVKRARYMALMPYTAMAPSSM